MAIYKRGKVYWFSFVFGGQRVQQTTKQKNRIAARDIESAYRTKLAKGEVDIVERAPVPSFSEFAKRFESKMRTDHQAKPKTVVYYLNGLTKLRAFFVDVRLDRVTKEQIDAFVAKRRAMKKKNGKPLTVATVNRELEVLRRMLRLAQEWGTLDRVPKISRMPGEVQRERVLDHSEEQAYPSVAKQPLRDAATLIIDGGFRPEEVFRMSWEDVHFDPAGKALYGYVHVPIGKTKYARRNVSLTARVKALLEMRHETQKKPSEGWVFPASTKSGRVESLKSQHKAALKTSGVKAFVLYSLRHTMLTRLGEAGADAFAIQRIAGHSSILIRQIYSSHSGADRGRLHHAGNLQCYEGEPAQRGAGTRTLYHSAVNRGIVLSLEGFECNRLISTLTSTARTMVPAENGERQDRLSFPQ